jgi:SAM-dependent methyltransferase
MHRRDETIYASAPVRRLQDEETRAMTPALQRCVGDYALLIGTSPEDAAPPALPMLGCWIRMQLHGGRYRGDVLAAGDEPLPFVDDAFELVLLQHALEASAVPGPMLDEAIRVLAPGGVLAITGVHPMSAWAPWFRWRSRGAGIRLGMPLRWIAELQREGFEIELAQRVGGVWPGAGMAPALSAKLLGGGFVLIARKRRRVVTPLRIKPVPVAVPATARLSPSTRRSATL